MSSKSSCYYQIRDCISDSVMFSVMVKTDAWIQSEASEDWFSFLAFYFVVHICSFSLAINATKTGTFNFP